MDAATDNRRVPLVRIEQGHSGTPPGFIDILNGVPVDDVDAVVAEVHGNANYCSQGKARQAYEVLAYANELVCYGRPFQDFHTRLFAWELLCPVHKMKTFEVAANNFGRLRRAWPETVFLSRRKASELSVPFAQEAGMEEYLHELIEVSHEAEQSVEDKLDARTVALTSPFRAPSYARAHRRARDAAHFSSRVLLPTPWCSGVVRAPRHFDLSRCFPRYPRWWLNRGVLIEIPYALSYLAHKLFDEFSADWNVPRGIGAAALALAWNRQTEALRQAVENAHGYVLEDAVPVLDRAMSVAADSAVAFDLFSQDVERLGQVAAVPPPPVRFDAGEILGRRLSRDDEDEEEPPRHMRRRSSSVDGGSRGPVRN